MKPSDRFVLRIAWANFLLALVGILKFLPLLLVALQSTVVSNSTVAWRWSLDLISDTQWIFLLWALVLLALRSVTGRLLFFSLAIQREKPIAPLHRNPGNFKPARADPK
jgi:hypothetical protein